MHPQCPPLSASSSSSSVHIFMCVLCEYHVMKRISLLCNHAQATTDDDDDDDEEGIEREKIDRKKIIIEKLPLASLLRSPHECLFPLDL
jgi:hypothetical protein